MIDWKNALENIILIAVVFLGLGVYTSLVLKPIVVEAIRTENTKIENNIKTDINNKFKKIDELNANLPLNITPNNTQTQSEVTDTNKNDFKVPNGFVLIEIKHLTRRQKKRLNID